MLIRPPASKALAFLIILGIVACLVPAFPVFAQEENIIQGVRLGELDLGEMGPVEFNEALKKVEEGLSGAKAALRIDEKIIENLTYADLGIKADRNKIWEEAYRIGREGNWFKRTWTRFIVKRNGYQVVLHLAFDREKFGKTLREKTLSYRKEPRDASFFITSRNTVEIIPEVYGRDIDFKKAEKDLEDHLAVITPGEPLILDLSPMELIPARLKSELEGFGVTGLLGQFTTSFNPHRVGRTNNIRLASKALDGVLVAPQEVFSFNEVVGPRTKERGYDEADIIVKNELVPGVGGGVCQVSTTLYNSVLLACLEIVERHPHSMVIPYVGPGLDATVNYGYLDFRFRNNSGNYLLIKTQLKESALVVKIFGAAELYAKKAVIKNVKEREIPPQTIYREDFQVPKGQYILEREGIPGMVYKVERYIYDSAGKLIKKEFISRDYYQPVDRVIRTSSGSAILSNPEKL